MKDDFDSSLLGSGGLIKRGYRLLAENVGKTIALITGLIAVLVSFTEIGFYDLQSEQLTANLILITLSSYIIYFSMEDAGERLGRESDSYKAALTEYEEVSRRLRASDTPGLREYCREYINAELEYRRGRAIAESGLSEEEYRDYLSGKKMPLKARFSLYRIKKMRPLSLGVGTLLSSSGRATEEIRDPDAFKPIKLLLSLIPSTICTLFTVSVMLTARDGLTAQMVIETILKLSCLPIMALRGYSRGYNHAKEGQSGWLRFKASLLKGYLGSGDNGNIA